MSIKYRNVGTHILAWLLFLLYEWLFKQGVLNNPETSLFNLKIVAIRVLILIPSVYFTLYLLVPRLFLKGHKMVFIFSTIGTIAIAALLMRTFNYFLVLKGVPGFAESYWKLMTGVTGWLIFMGNIAFNISFALMFFFINKWVKDERKRKELEAVNKEVELQLLKSQVQPHFLFNTLNNIYALSLKDPSKTSEMIYRLSGLLEYMLYDSNRVWILLSKEITYIRNYLEIEKIRYGSRLDVSYQTYGNLEYLYVPPLILLPFVENSFKHGLSQQTEYCWLRIEVHYQTPWLLMKVENSKPHNLLDVKKTGGLGILNVRKRLEILMGEDYDLKQYDAPDSYLILLKLKPKFNVIQHEESTRSLEVLGR